MEGVIAARKVAIGGTEDRRKRCLILHWAMHTSYYIRVASALATPIRFSNEKLRTTAFEWVISIVCPNGLSRADIFGLRHIWGKYASTGESSVYLGAVYQSTWKPGA